MHDPKSFICSWQWNSITRAPHTKKCNQMQILIFFCNSMFCSFDRNFVNCILNSKAGIKGTNIFKFRYDQKSFLQNCPPQEFRKIQTRRKHITQSFQRPFAEKGLAQESFLLEFLKQFVEFSNNLSIFPFQQGFF